MSERVVNFGKRGQLSGVLNTAREMQADGAQASPPGLLFFNAGLVHRIGAHRLNVKLARALAGQGRQSLRFDLSGLGDSAPADGERSFERQSLADIGAALDVMAAAFACEDVVAVGMCSGADNAYRAALDDARLKGLILLDPYAYPNKAAQQADFLARARDAERWAHKAKSLIIRGRATKEQDEEAASPFVDEQARPVAPREAFGGDLATLTDRGVEILIVYTGFVRSFVSKPSHFFETFGDFDFSGRAEIVTMPHTDHTYAQLSAQRELSRHIADWLDARFPAKPAGGA